MKKKTRTGVALLATLLLLAGCGQAQSKQNKGEQAAQATEQVSSTALEVDDLLAQAPQLVGQEVSVEGICTHICAHGGRKIFLMGSDDTQTIRVESGGQLGAFKADCVNSLVQVSGTLVEDRIDEAYLQNWEAQLQANTQEEHGEGEEGCSTEKAARGETANSTEARIADFRARIAQREEAEGKAYLSFYHLEAKEYEIR